MHLFTSFICRALSIFLKDVVLYSGTAPSDADRREDDFRGPLPGQRGHLASGAWGKGGFRSPDAMGCAWDPPRLMGMKVQLWLCPAPPCPGAILETRATEYLGQCTGNTCPMGRKMLEYLKGDAGLCKKNMGHSWILVTRKQKPPGSAFGDQPDTGISHRLAARWW